MISGNQLIIALLLIMISVFLLAPEIVEQLYQHSVQIMLQATGQVLPSEPY
ncbi:hypothetical protein VME0621_01232 [Vibrio mediterranei]|uniref:hypothetical protein n=1 Tax=Vibrio mediterranei TaxID=689 RepID=UPI0007F53811|nr:hypothetical protein [Vibrio mediterranei]SBO09139.1 hypothetical protein VME0621_01232 [Vibrio mediterranei]